VVGMGCTTSSQSPTAGGKQQFTNAFLSSTVDTINIHQKNKKFSVTS